MEERKIVQNILPTSSQYWKVGSLSTSGGQISDNSKRLRTKDYIPIESQKDYFCNIQNSQYKFVNIQYYDITEKWLADQNNISEIYGYQTKEITTPINTAYIKVVLRRTDEANITIEEFDNIGVTIIEKS